MADLKKWMDDINTNGRPAWIRAYVSALAYPISDPERFFKSLDVLGETPMLQAIVISSTKNLTSDPLNYVLAVAYAQAQVEIEENKNGDRYLFSIERSKATTESYNKSLAERIERAKQLTEGD